MSRLRAAGVLASFMGLTLPLMPVQALLLSVSQSAARGFPHWYHRKVCRILGIRLHIEGAVAKDTPVLLVSNHTSWLDIPVLSAVAPVSFVAKSEVGRWPFVSALARLQRTVFVDRTRRVAVGDTANEMAERLAQGDTLVLFAEGTSTDGNRVLPFKSSLFGAAKPSGNSNAPNPPIVVQTVAIVYARVHGIPLGRADRPFVGWYGDMDMQSHAWELLQAGPLDVVIRISPPVPLDAYAGRKELAEKTEAAVRENVVRTLRGRPPGEPVALAATPKPATRTPLPRAASETFR
ncbi:MAG: 1-acyl-sn-glycerol-3-phosphate acyltransferase [Hyphomicrobium sp.]|nr:1-acyl-sn-glycerol-3-phosphate acyltransferase [Hyphomicrobium sp.]PPD07422.1 MAG: 1-acyl-sn-glycerol-3-phosphate acyltransferase [Hyphomicrobium sp.]